MEFQFVSLITMSWPTWNISYGWFGRYTYYTESSASILVILQDLINVSGVSMSLFILLFGMTINTFLFGHFTRTFSNSKTEYFINLTRHLFQHRLLINYKYYRKTSRLLGCKNRLLPLRGGVWMQRTKPR